MCFMWESKVIKGVPRLKTGKWSPARDLNLCCWLGEEDGTTRPGKWVVSGRSEAQGNEFSHNP